MFHQAVVDRVVLADPGQRLGAVNQRRQRPGQQRGEGLLVDLPGGQGVIQRAVAAAELRYQRQLDQQGHRVIGAQDRVAQLEARIRPGGQAPVQPGTELPQRQVPVNRAGDLRRVRRGRQHCRRRGRGRHRQRELLPAGQRCENMVVQRSLPRPVFFAETSNKGRDRCLSSNSG